MSRTNLICCLLFTGFAAHSQGCSDAGFCTMGAMKPDQPYSNRLKVRLRSIDISQYFGHTRFNNKIWVTTLEANIGLGSKYVFQAKLPYLVSQGKLGAFQSVSDISLSLTRNVVSTDAFDINVTVGAKLPTNDGNLAKWDNKSLPMYYQTSLGTYDFIFGASLVNRKWLVAAGYQQALNANGNGFWFTEWQGDENMDYIEQYSQSNKLQRGKDIMVRVERNFRFSRFNASIGLLPIWRLTLDRVVAPATGIEQESPGSDGLALSGIYTLGYNLNVKSGFKLLMGNRFIERKSNPDGLSREVVVSMTYSYRF